MALVAERGHARVANHFLRLESFQDFDPHPLGKGRVNTTGRLDLDRTGKGRDEVAGQHLMRRPPGRLFQSVELGRDLGQHRADRFGIDRPSPGAERGVDLGQQTLGRKAAKVGQRDQAGLQAVFDVVDRIGDIIGHVHDLALRAALLTAAGRTGDRLDQLTICGVIALDRFVPGRGQPCGIETGLVFQQPVEAGIGEVQARIGGVFVFEPGHDAKGLGVALKTAIGPHAVVQEAFPGVAEGGVAKIVGQTGRLDQVGIRAQRQGNALGNLGDFERVGQPGPKEIALIHPKHLGFALEAPKRGRVDDTGPVVFKLGPVVVGRPRRLRGMPTGV